MATNLQNEPEIIRNCKTGGEILQLTHGPFENKHSYYDVMPWSPDGRELVYSSAAPETLVKTHRDNLASEEGRVFALDMNTFAPRLLAEKAFFTTHTGTYATWHPGGDRVYFFRSSNTVEAVDRESGRTVRRFAGALRQFRPDGSCIAYTTRETSENGPAGVYTVGEDGSGIACLATTEELCALTPNRSQFSEALMHVKNTKWSPDGSTLLVANGIWTAPFENAPGIARSLYVIHPVSGEKRWLCHFGHHHSWTPDGRSVLFCGKLETGEPRIFRADLAGGRVETLCDEPLEGHPLASPDGTRVATEDDDGILVVDVAARKSRRVARYGRRFDKSHKGTHSHCAWSPDGSQLLYNSAETGASQLYLILNP